MIIIKKNKINFSAESQKFSLKNKSSGSICSFLGKVRKNSTNGDVKSIYIEYYPEMTKKQIKEIIFYSNKKWKLDDLLIIHRYGRIEVEENIVLILLASQHRKDSLESLEFIIDWLKVKATFWKKEETLNGNFWVKEKKSDLKRINKYNFKYD